MRTKPRLKRAESARVSEGSRLLTVYLPVLFSLIALGLSAWAVVESREAGLQARRADVRDQIRDLVKYGQETYARSVCILSVAKGQEAMAAKLASGYEKSAKGLDEIRATSDIIQTMDRDDLNRYERLVETGYPVFRKMRDTSNHMKTLLTVEELEQFERVCE